MPERLAGRVAVVTGGGAGIGAAICQRLSEEGAHVVVADTNASAAEKVASGLKRGMPYRIDMANDREVQALASAAVRWGGHLDIWVNNAAVFAFGSATEASPANWDQALGINVKGYASGIKHAAQAMIAHRHEVLDSKAQGSEDNPQFGHAIVNISSISAFIAQESFVPYSASKGAINQITRCCALDLGKHNIRVNAVCPGPVITDGTKKHADLQGVPLQEAIDSMTGHMIIKRMGRTEEVAAAVAFLASDDASFITGTMLNVDGGYLAV